MMTGLPLPSVVCRSGDRCSLGALFSSATDCLVLVGIESAQTDARLLIAEATGGDVADPLLYPERDVGAAEQACLERLVARRMAREPMSQILGDKGFRDLEFLVTPDVLTPRPETETLIECVLDRLVVPPVRILDLGTGSGCIVLSLLSVYSRAVAVALDISEAALAVARTNARRHGLDDRVRFMRSDWFGAVADQSFDLIVSNPPYIPSTDIAGLDPEVRVYEPLRAVDGGHDGLDAYRALVPQISDHLLPGGWAALEVGIGQADVVAKMFPVSDFGAVGSAPDLAGIERIVMARWTSD